MQVESLKDRLVTQVACGSWHTAAIGAPRPQGPNNVDTLPFIERLAVQHKLAAMYELTEEVCPGRLSVVRTESAQQHEPFFQIYSGRLESLIGCKVLAHLHGLSNECEIARVRSILPFYMLLADVKRYLSVWLMAILFFYDDLR